MLFGSILTQTFWTCYCCSLLRCKSLMLSVTGTCCLANRLYFFLNPSKNSNLRSCMFALLFLFLSSLLLLSTQRPPACSTLTFAAVLRPSKLRCSMHPLLDCVQLTALRPRGSPGQWPSTKAPGASSTSPTRFPQPRETAVANPILLQNTHTHTDTIQYIHTNTYTHIDVCPGLAVIFILYFWEKGALMLFEIETFNKRC